jgi:hypothetical protein
MSKTDFIPRKDADFLQWTVNFLTVLVKILQRVGFPQRGKTVYFALRWENTRGEKGPWSEIMSAIIP